jgi:hypothetical protein
LVKVWRRQIWTDTCTEVGWKVTFGTAAHDEFCLNNRDHTGAIFLKQNLGWSNHITWFNKWRRWRIMLRNEPDQRQLEELKTWLAENYPGIDVELDYEKMPLMRGRSILASGLFLQALVTASHAAWTLIWLYGHPALRWTALIERSVFAAICRSRRVWFLFMFTKLLAWVVTFGVYGGIAVISVELLEAVCGQVISLSPGIWVLTASLIFLSYSFALASVYFLPQIIGKILFISGLIH